MEIKLKTVTPLWTGDINRKCSKIKETGIIGSLRWWYEVLVRGMGGYACDPTSDKVPFKKCELNQDEFDKAIKIGESVQEALDEQICPACQLFGCTGWSRKFRAEMSIEKIFRSNPIQGFEGILKLNLLEIKRIREEEKWLLMKIFEIIEEYGSIGGRTTRKPQRNERVGGDYGLVSVENMEIETNATKSDVKTWLLNNKTMLSMPNNEEWPAIKHFFFVKGKFLWRAQMNELMGLSEDGRKIVGYEGYQEFLRGERRERGDGGKSKRIFSFKADGGRIWGYAKDRNMLKEIETKLKQMNVYPIIKGEEVLS